MRPIFAIGTSLTLVASVIIGQAYSQGVDEEFEALTTCQKLDAIAADGKDVVNYIVDSGFIVEPGYEEFADDILEECPQHLVDFGKAWETMAEDPLHNLFDRLSPCAQLNAIESSNKSLPEFIIAGGYSNFARPVLDDCPRHLEELGIAWLTLNPENLRGGDEGTSGPTPDENPEASDNSAIAFEDLPRCEQLDVIASNPDKSVVSHIFLSGIEDYEYAVRSQCSRHLEALRQAEELESLQRQNTVTELSLDFAITPASNDALDPEFESLSPCQKLQVIEGSGKSLPQYIADSGIEDFENAVYGMCRRYIPSVVAAEGILENAN